MRRGVIRHLDDTLRHRYGGATVDSSPLLARCRGN